MGAATTLAKSLDQQFSVEVVGPDFGQGLNPMYVDQYNYRIIDASDQRLLTFPSYFKASKAFAEQLEGRLIFCVKSYMNTTPLAWHMKKTQGRKMGVYLDEWDGALWHRLSPLEKLKTFRREMRYTLSDYCCAKSEKYISKADLVFSTTQFLKERFGGEVTRYGVDSDFFKRQDSVELKQSLGLADKFVLVFGGVVRPHKGLELFLQALAERSDPDLHLLIVGPENDVVQGYMNNPEYRSYISCTDSLKREQMPEYLSVADVLIVPLGDDLLAQSQMPCKIFESMAMAKPVIATKTPDIADVLGGEGWMIDSGTVAEVLAAIREIRSDILFAQHKASSARERVCNLYSEKAVSERIINAVEKCLHA